jgi:hypothetical protein
MSGKMCRMPELSMEEHRTVRQQSPCLVYFHLKRKKENKKERNEKCKEKKGFVVTATSRV